MGKRRPGETDDANQRRHKKHKNHAASITPGPAEDRDPSSLAPDLEPPSDLNRGQRKRWRRRQKQRWKAENESKLQSRSPANKLETPRVQLISKTSSSLGLTKRPTPVDPSMLQRYATTRLVRIPQKQWCDDRTPSCSDNVDGSPSKTDEESEPIVQIGRPSTPKPTVSVKHNLSPPSSRLSTRKNDSQQPETKMTSLRAEALFDTKQLSSKPVTSERSRPSRSLLPSPAITRLSPEQAHGSSAAKIRAPSLKHGLLEAPILNAWSLSGMGNRQKSSRFKTNSVPTHSEETDVATSFERFTAFLHGKEGESSDQESDAESESDVSTDSGQLPVVSSGITTLAQPLVSRKSAPGTDLQQKPLPETREIKPTMSPARPLSGHGSTPLTQIRANVGIKRQVSPNREEQARPKTSDSFATLQLSIDNDASLHDSALPFSSAVSEEDDSDSDTLFRTIDEISHDVFSVSRSLPACKSPVSPDLVRKRDQGKRLMSRASSARRLIPSKLASLNLKDAMSTPDIPIPQNVVVTCHCVQVPDVETPTAARPNPIIVKHENHGLESTSVEAEHRIAAEDDDSDSSLSELSHTPSPPPELEAILGVKGNTGDNHHSGTGHVTGTVSSEAFKFEATPEKRKRKMTGMTSKHFTPQGRKLRKRQSAPSVLEAVDNIKPDPDVVDATEPGLVSDSQPVTRSQSTARKQRKGTGRKSTYFAPTKPALDPNIIDRVDFYNTTAGKRSKALSRNPAGISTRPVPPITGDRFGIIQEKLWREPFWLLIAVTFLNKTTGRAAAPVFWMIKDKYVTPEALATAPQEDLEALVWHLGLQRQRSKRLIKIAQAWIDAPPQKGMSRRTLHYPIKGDGKGHKPFEIITEDTTECNGALEIGHIPGCGPYAWDSWRMFCRDVLRGVADDYNGGGRRVEGFEAEWKRVLPLDKELRACLRWMWLREGWVWNCISGDKRRATAEEMELAVLGEMEFADEKEREFAALAAGAEVAAADDHDDGKEGEEDVEDSEHLDGSATVGAMATLEPSEDLAENIVVSPEAAHGLRRSARLTA